jgi:peptidoglycan/xylan/chitin deacetylase (PgdA/CDA1 family)
VGRDVLALCYHAISERWPAALSITPDRFEAHISFLATRGYRGVTFDEAVRGPDADRAVAITFDDAYRSVLELARPILDRYAMPATVFVPTAFAGTEKPMSWRGIDHWPTSEYAAELVPMSWEELGQLVGANWEIGSHTRTHPWLTLLDDRRLAEELAGSREECERRLGVPCRSLAYPYGDHDQRIMDAARTAGYSAAGTLSDSERLPRVSPPHAYPRIGIYRGDDAWRFRLKASRALRRLRTSTLWAVVDRARDITRPRDDAERRGPPQAG